MKKNATGELAEAAQVGMRDRMRAAVKECVTLSAAADIAELSTDQLARILQGTSSPGFLPLARLAAFVGIDLTWLAYGVAERHLPSERSERVFKYALSSGLLGRDKIIGPAMQAMLRARTVMGAQTIQVSSTVGQKLCTEMKAIYGTKDHDPDRDDELAGCLIDILTESGLPVEHWEAAARAIVGTHRMVPKFLNEKD